MSVSNQSIPVAVDRPAPRDASNRQTSASESSKPPASYFTPPIDIHEGPDGLILEADLPGATENNVSIQLEDNVLSLYAKINTPAARRVADPSSGVSGGRLLPLVHSER